MKIVLDTCALIWWSLDPDKLSTTAKDACREMEKKKNGLVPSISIWEIARQRAHAAKAFVGGFPQ